MLVAEWKNRGKEDKDYEEFWEDLLEEDLVDAYRRNDLAVFAAYAYLGITCGDVR